jgi:uncharacterized repeat protein (TIGR01451 family)
MHIRQGALTLAVMAALSAQAHDKADRSPAFRHEPVATGAKAHFRFPAHAHPSTDSVLYDQSGVAEGAVPAQDFQSIFDAFDSEGADDFVVTDAAGWTLGAFNFQVLAQFSSSPPDSTYGITVYEDENGLPGAPVCGYADLPGTLDASSTSLSVALTTPCVLAAGRYWVGFTAHLNFPSKMYWMAGPNAAIDNIGAWREPGDGDQTGCTAWTSMSSCTVPGGPTVGEGDLNLLFQVVGSVGSSSCTPGGICLTATVGTDLTLDACGSADTIDAIAGDQLNFCYTVTNGTGLPLDYHTLQNNVDGTLFQERTISLPPGASTQYNVVETVGATNTWTSTWSAQDVPSGYTADVETGGGNCSDRIFADGFEAPAPGCPGSNFIDITTTGTPLGLADDAESDVTMPFSFNFYGTTSNQICVDNNGIVLFGTTCPGAFLFSNASLPASLPWPAIMPLWDDFDSESGDVFTDTRGATPSRQFIVEWFDRVHYDGSSNTDGATFELIFNEDGTLEFQYADVAYTGFASGDVDDCGMGVCATIGLQGDATLFNQFSAFQASVTDDSGIVWTATSPQVFMSTDSVTVNVGAPDINVEPGTLSGTVIPGGTTTLPLDVQNLGNRNLVWNADEALPANFHFPYGPRYAPSTLAAGEKHLAAIQPSAGWRAAHAHKPGTHRTAPHVAAVPSFGCSITSSSSCDYVSFDADSPATLDTVATENELVFGASFVADDFTKEYIVGYPSGDLETIDTATGVRTTVGSTGQGTATRDIAYDLQTGTLFGTAIDGSGTDLFTVDTTTGAMTLVGPITGLGSQAYVMGLAVDPNTGLMYGIEVVSSSLVAIDKTTGAATTIGALGFTTRFGQGLDFDAATGVLYLASIDYSAGMQNMYTVDTVTGGATLISPIGNNVIQLGAFGIAVPSGPCGTPADQPWLSLNPTSGTTGPGSDTPVTATIDATGAADGDILSGTVCVRSNDPDEHVVAVPISVNVTNAPPPPVPPTVTKSFNPTQVTPGESSTLTITLSNNAGVDSMLTASLTDNLPPGMDIAIPPQAATTCGGAVSSTAQSVTLDAAGSTIPAGGSCTVEVNVTVGGIGTFDNVIPAAALQTSTGDNANAATATLASHVPPTISKEFNPQTVAVDAPSTLTITIANIDPGAATLAAPLVDAFPAGLVVAPAPNEATTCSGGLTANGGADSIMLDAGAIVPSGGCTITVNVVASAAGSYANDIPAGALQTDFGTNATPADATLDVN